MRDLRWIVSATLATSRSSLLPFASGGHRRGEGGCPLALTDEPPAPINRSKTPR
jgi:hypothetical protein